MRRSTRLDLSGWVFIGWSLLGVALGWSKEGVFAAAIVACVYWAAGHVCREIEERFP